MFLWVQNIWGYFELPIIKTPTGYVSRIHSNIVLTAITTTDDNNNNNNNNNKQQQQQQVSSNNDNNNNNNNNNLYFVSSKTISPLPHLGDMILVLAEVWVIQSVFHVFFILLDLFL